MGASETVTDDPEYTRQRYAALREVSREVCACAAAGSGTVAVRGYGPGRMVLGLAGTFPADDARLAEIERDLRWSAHTELVVEMAALDVTDRGTCRWLAAVRMRRLVTGARVLLLMPRADAVPHLRVDRPEEFVVIDNPSPEPEPAHADLLPRGRPTTPRQHAARPPHAGPGPGRRPVTALPGCPRR